MVNAAMVAVIQSLVETIAIAVGGLWVAWTFHKLQSVRAAEANLASTLKATEKTSLDAKESERRLLAQQPNLDISIVDLAQHQSPGSEQRHLALGVNLRNLGSRNLSVEFDKATLSVGLYTLSNKGLPEMADVSARARTICQNQVKS
jgi:hypothetical protein